MSFIYLCVILTSSCVQMGEAASRMKTTRVINVSVLPDGLDPRAWKILMTVKRAGARMEALVKMESMNTGTNMPPL